MQEKVQGQLARSATGRQVAIFFAGSDPLNSVYRLLADWLDARRIEYASVDIDDDPTLACLKQKELSEAVLPILCVAGRVAATGSVLQSLLESGQLETLLSSDPSAPIPALAVTEGALAVWRAALRSPVDAIRLNVSASYEHSLCVDAAQSDDVKLTIADVILVMDPQSASRANGVAIDWVTSDKIAGFRIDNPNAAPNPREISCADLTRILRDPVLPLVIDVRTDDEYQGERLPSSKHLNADLVDALALLDRRTRLLFYCDNGRRSRGAALRYVELGFVSVAVLAGGINAWKIHLVKSEIIG
jgi:monothiol glutaredoxin